MATRGLYAIYWILRGGVLQSAVLKHADAALCRLYKDFQIRPSMPAPKGQGGLIAMFFQVQQASGHTDLFDADSDGISASG